MTGAPRGADPHPDGPIEQGAEPPTGRSVAVYTVFRLAVFALTALVLWLVGIGGLGLWLLALLVSGVLSYVVLAPQRIRMAQAVESSVRERGPIARWRRRIRATEAAEDAYADAVGEQPNPPAQQPGS